MKRLLASTLVLLPLLQACKTTPQYGRELPAGAPALIPLGHGDEVPDFSLEWERRGEILPALDNSLMWMRRPHAADYYPAADITYDRALASLERFRQLLDEAYGPEEFQKRIEEEFTIYKSAGWNGRGGGVLFTAYCTPILPGSLEQTAEFRYPLYALPPDLVKDASGRTLGWETQVGLLPGYPSRGAIEAGGLLDHRELELVWLSDPIDAYLAHVNGSAFIQLLDGSMYRLGYAGKNGRRYVSLGRELEEDGVLPKGEASLQSIRDWAGESSPDEITEYLHRNESYVFFAPIDGKPHGSLDVEVTGERSLATDKSLFPPGALVFVETEVADRGSSKRSFRRFLLDQDTGGAIRTAGRADIYLGVGPNAEQRAGQTKSEGQMYYLFLKE